MPGCAVLCLVWLLLCHDQNTLLFLPERKLANTMRDSSRPDITACWQQTRQQAPVPSSSGYSSSSSNSTVTITTGVAQLHPWICNSAHRLGCMNFIYAMYSAETYAVGFFCWVRQLFITHTCNEKICKRQVENHLPKLQVTVTA